MSTSPYFADKADIEKLDWRMEKLDMKIEGLDKRLSLIQWIGVIFLALNGSLIATLLWTLGVAITRMVGGGSP